MTHKAIQKKMLRYLDDELSGQEKAKVQRHLERCKTCRDALQTIKSLWITERPPEQKNAPLLLWTYIAAGLQSPTERGVLKGSENPGRQLLRPVMTVVALIIICFSGIKLGNLITGSTGDVAQVSAESAIDNFGMSYFGISPPGSLDAHVLALTESEMQQ